MPQPIRRKKMIATWQQMPRPNTGSATVERLTDEHETEALRFLGSRTVDTLYMIGLIQDNGLDSPFNRGAFYGYRDDARRLQGVALIGHATLVETQSEDALAAFARLAQANGQAHVIVGDQEKLGRFWRYYGKDGRARPRLICRELLFEQRSPIAALEPVEGLRPATLDDLSPVMAVQARMAEAESGTNPMEQDAEGFRLRTARRIEQGRVWVWTEGERLMFKADIMSETSDMTYLEGIHVHSEERRKGYGLRCMSQLGRHLLSRTGSLCLLVNEQNKDAQDFFFKAGYKLRSCYDTIFLQSSAN
jgi:predicted GNAT family acetyltransferase